MTLPSTEPVPDLSRLIETNLNHALSLIANSAPLQVVLNALNLGVERACPGLLSSVLIIERGAKKRLYHLAAESLPESYCRTIDRLIRSRTCGFEGISIFLRKQTVVSDIQSSTLWADLRELAAAHRLRAGVSQPILSSAGNQLGVLAGYFRTPKTPTATELQVIHRAAQLAGIAIEKKQAEVALQKSQKRLRTQEARLRLTFDNASTGFLTCRPSGEIIVANRAFCELLGRAMEEIIGNSIDSLGDPDAVEEAEELRTRICRRQIARVERKLCLYRKDGHRLYCIERTQPLTDSNGEVTQLVTEIENITENKRWELEFLRVSRLESVGILASGLAHDFRNLLTTVLGSTEMMKRSLDPLEPLGRKLEDIERAAKRAQQLSVQLLQVAKGQSLEQVPFSILAPIRDSLHLVLTGTPIVCELDVPDEATPVVGNECQITQVFHNLILNARQAMPDGGTLVVRCEKLEVSEQSEVDLPLGRYICVTIADEGPGIPADVVSKIFDPFFTTKPEGSGLGLAVSAHIIREHRGRITVNSTPGVGSTFQVYLPESVEQPAAQETTSLPLQVPPIRSKGKRVLIMDDDRLVRETAGSMLDLLGYDVEFTSDGWEALKHYRAALQANRPFDVVLLDLSVKLGMGGESTIGRLQKIDPGVRAIVTSGYTQDPVMANHTRYGFCGAVSKPFEIDLLKKTIEEALNSLPPLRPTRSVHYSPASPTTLEK